MEYITFIHERENIDNLSEKERSALLDKLIDNGVELHDKEKKYLSKEQEQKYTNQEFDTKRWVTPNEWKHANEIQRTYYLNNQMRAAISPELFACMSKEWKETVLSQVYVSGGKYLDEERFDALSESEKSYYVNRKLTRSFSFFPFEIPYLTTSDKRIVIDKIIDAGEDFTRAQKDAFNAHDLKYYEKRMNQKREGTFKIEESLRKYIRKILSESV